MSRSRAWVEINLRAIEENYIELERLCATPVAAVVKANGYGHGAITVASAVSRLGARTFAVACVDEALELRSGGITGDILILAPTPEARLAEVFENNFIQTVTSVEYAKKLKSGTRVHIKVDTGMGRLGVKTAEEVREIYEICNAEGIFTHFAESDDVKSDFTLQQMDKFEKIIAESGVGFKYVHCANSGAVLNYPRARKFSMVRPGLLLYGLYPEGKSDVLKLTPAMSLKARVCDVRDVKAGESVSYGRTFVAEQNMRVAVLPIGYADGLSRALSGVGEAFIAGKRVPIIGRICMDLCVIDVTGLEVKVGDVAELFGENISANEVAEKCGTIPYEIIVSVGKRIPRVATPGRANII